MDIFILVIKIFLYINLIVLTDITRMTTFIKAKLNKSDDQMNIDKFRVAANITEYHNVYEKKSS